MVTTLFLIIAFCIRKRFIAADTKRSDKILYYLFSVCLTPLVGPWVFKLITDGEPADPNEPSTGVYTNPDFL